jgi:ribosomal protein L11 methyltransferase
MSDWNYLEFEISSRDLETVSSLLWDLGTSGIEEGNFDQAQTRAKAFFPEGIPIHRVQQDLSVWCKNVGIRLNALSAHRQEARDWLAEWRSQWNPFPVGNRFFIIPLKDSKQAIPLLRIPILLEPGMAFGTGTHETTQLCLESLERLVTPGISLLDLGTGSGILAIAACKLGARSILGVDIDPEAVSVARENGILNGCGQKIEWRKGGADSLGRRKFDLVVANLTLDPIERMLPSLAKRLKPGGTIILSGLLRGQETRLVPLFKPCRLRKLRVRSRGEWIAVMLRKPLE